MSHRNSHQNPSTVWQPDRLADSLMLLIAMTVVQRFIGFVRGMLVCRWLAPAELGQWDLALGFLELAAPLAMLGLPGSFGRYAEHYREQGQLRTFIRRTAGGTIVAMSAAVGLMLVARHQISQIVFGTPDDTSLVLLLAIGVAAIGTYYFLTSLLTALRRSRIVSGLEFVNSLLFALLALSLLAGWTPTASKIVAAYAIACLVTGGLSWLWLKPIWNSLPEPSTTVSHRSLWGKLVPFAVWVWGTNWIANLFELADRYMIIHWGRLDAEQALVEVGNYHSSRVVPLLLVSVTGLLGTMLTPYLSHDWERAGAPAVSRRLNFTLKLLTIFLMCGATAILWCSPLLFGVAFQGKYDGGRVVLPLTLAYCVWFGLARVAQKYLWCAERVSLAAAAWLLGLVVNIGLNLVLLPRFGLPGVVASTALGNLAALITLYLLNRSLGMTFARGTCILSAAPALLVLGPWLALAGTLLMLGILWQTCWLLDAEEKQQIIDVRNDYLIRYQQWIGRHRIAGNLREVI